MVPEGELRIKNYTQVFYISEFFYLVIRVTIVYKILCLNCILYTIWYTFAFTDMFTYLSIGCDLHTERWRQRRKEACRVVMTLRCFRYTKQALRQFAVHRGNEPTKCLSLRLDTHYPYSLPVFTARAVGACHQYESWRRTVWQQTTCGVADRVSDNNERWLMGVSKKKRLLLLTASMTVLAIGTGYEYG